MERKVNVSFKDGFKFPKEYDYDHCGESCIFCHCDTYDCVDYCSISDKDNKCPFYGKQEDEAIDI